jgi:hypothetical protein
MRDDGRQAQEAEEEFLWIEELKKKMDEKMIEIMKTTHGDAQNDFC